MKNPFVKNDNSFLIVSVAAGMLVLGSAAYFFLTDNGKETKKKLKHKVKEGIKDKASDLVSKKTKIPKKAVKAVADHVAK